MQIVHVFRKDARMFKLHFLEEKLLAACVLSKSILDYDGDERYRAGKLALPLSLICQSVFQHREHIEELHPFTKSSKNGKVLRN